MGFFSKLWKGIKKVAKKIFKPIKSVFKAVGKFMNKIGIVGQIAMSFILPGIGSVLAQTFGKAVSALAGGALGSVGKAAGWILGKAGTFAKTIGQGFKTVTSAVTDFIGTTGKYVGGKLGIPGMDKMTLGEAFGKEGWGGRLSDSISKLGAEASNFWQSDLESFAKRGISSSPQGTFNTPEVDLDRVKEVAPEMAESGTKAFGTQQNPNVGIIPDQAATKAAYEKSMNQRFNIGELGDLTQATEPVGMGINLDNVAELGKTESKNWFSKGLEKVTGESSIEDVFKTAPGKAKAYAVDSLLSAPGDLVKGEFKKGLSNVLGFGPEEYVQGPSWGGYSPQMRSQLSEAAQMGLQPIMQDAYADYVASSSLNTNPQGIYGGANNYADYFKRMAVFQGQGG
jgi:hypothetical protein